MEQIMKPLTWAELKEKIETMPKEQLNENVKIWSEDIPLQQECYFETESEDLYFNEDFDFCYPESELEDYKKGRLYPCSGKREVFFKFLRLIMNKKLRNAVKLAEQKLNEASCAVQNIERYLTFARFDRDEPQVSACNVDEIILEYYGREIPIEDVIARMEKTGYITPDDFI